MRLQPHCYLVTIIANLKVSNYTFKLWGTLETEKGNLVEMNPSYFG